MKKGTLLTLSEKDLISVIMDNCPEIEQDKKIVIDSVIPDTEFDCMKVNPTAQKILNISFHVV